MIIMDSFLGQHNPSNYFALTFFYTVRYSFPPFYIFPGNRKTRRTEVLRVSYVWTQRTLRYSIFRYIRSTRLRFRYASSRSGIRPVSPSSNILIRVNSHRIFSSSLHCSLLIEYYSITVATRPDPTVRPPSRIANVRPWLIAIGWISSIVISMLSPGMHISVPSGRLQTPVTSVVLK